MTDVEDVKLASDRLRGDLATELESETARFSAASAHLLKFHGIYQQDDRDRRRSRTQAGEEPAYSCMVRCSIPGGILRRDQWLAIDRMADEVADGRLRITTRQGVQFHFVHKGDLKDLVASLNRRLVTTYAACGDVVRNIMVTSAPHRGRDLDRLDSLARSLANRFRPRSTAYWELWLDGDCVVSAGPSADATTADEAEPIYGDSYLPRKFKIAIAWPGDNAVDVYSNDVGIVAAPGPDGTPGGRRPGRRRARPQPHRPDDVPAAGPAPRLGPRRGDRRRRRGDRHRVPRRGQPRGPQPRPPEVPGGRTRHRLATRRGGAASRPPTRRPGAPPPLGSFPFRSGMASPARARTGGSWACRCPPGVCTTTAPSNAGPPFAASSSDTPTRSASHRTRTCSCATSPQRTRRRRGPAGRARRPARPSAAAVGGVVDGVPGAAHLRPGPRRSRAGAPRRDRPARPPPATERGLADVAIETRMTGCPNGCARPYVAELGIVGRTKTAYDLFVGGDAAGTRLATLADRVRPAEPARGRPGRPARPLRCRAALRRGLRRLGRTARASLRCGRACRPSDGDATRSG